MVTLSDGREINYDWTKIEQRDFLKFFIKKSEDDQAIYALLGKVIGMSVDELLSLNPIDYKHVEFGLIESYKEKTDFNNVKN